MATSLLKKISALHHIQYLTPFGLLITANHSYTIDAFISGEELKTLTRHYKLVICRDFTPFERPAFVIYAKTMGSLLEWDFGHVMEMKVQMNPKNYLFTNSHVPFHWDGAFHEEPRFLLFHCIEAPAKEAGGETLFTDTENIWLNASDMEKAAWLNYQLRYQTEKLAHYGGEITVPFVKNHPDTNKKILRFAEPVPTTMPNPVKVEMLEVDSFSANTFMTEMTARCYDKMNCYTHTWNQHDFLIADNHALLHARHAFKHFTPRHLRRIQIL